MNNYSYYKYISDRYTLAIAFIFYLGELLKRIVNNMNRLSMLLLLLQFFHSLSHIEARRVEHITDGNNMNQDAVIQQQQLPPGACREILV